MLDDFGLQPALEWLVRDFSRRSQLHVSGNFSGNLGSLADPHRTCVFRVVQEALTNCARHSGASSIAVDVKGENRGVTVSASDNGVGISPESRTLGLGLRGLEERASELNGTLTVESAPGKGTTLKLWIPVPPEDSVMKVKES